LTTQWLTLLCGFLFLLPAYKTSSILSTSTSRNNFFIYLSDDLKRLHRNNESRVPSTKYGAPWKLVWYKKCENRSEARKLELKIKKRGAKRFLNDLKS
jgi:putative endonuclease